MIRRLLLTLLVVVIANLTACGKYGRPLPPEDFAPEAVLELVVATSSQGVSFNWNAPKNDTRGNDLKDLEGYRVYRRELDQASRLVDPTAKYELIADIQDTHLKELLALKAQALEQGQISRKVSLPEERSKFAFVDRKVSPGKRYFYQVVPVNQGGVEGQIKERIDVVFKGELSEIVRVPYSAEELEF